MWGSLNFPFAKKKNSLTPMIGLFQYVHKFWEVYAGIIKDIYFVQVITEAKFLLICKRKK